MEERDITKIFLIFLSKARSKNKKNRIIKKKYPDGVCFDKNPKNMKIGIKNQWILLSNFKASKKVNKAIIEKIMEWCTSFGTPIWG